MRLQLGPSALVIQTLIDNTLKHKTIASLFLGIKNPEPLEWAQEILGSQLNLLATMHYYPDDEERIDKEFRKMVATFKKYHISITEAEDIIREARTKI